MTLPLLLLGLLTADDDGDGSAVCHLPCERLIQECDTGGEGGMNSMCGPIIGPNQLGLGRGEAGMMHSPSEQRRWRQG